MMADETELVGLRTALGAIERTAFIGATTDSDETRRVALDSIHDIARAALSGDAS